MHAHIYMMHDAYIMHNAQELQLHNIPYIHPSIHLLQDSRKIDMSSCFLTGYKSPNSLTI